MSRTVMRCHVTHEADIICQYLSASVPASIMVTIICLLLLYPDDIIHYLRHIGRQSSHYHHYPGLLFIRELKLEIVRRGRGG